MNIINLLLVVVLIIATAYFVTAEFAIVKVRESRIEQLIQEGNKRAKDVKAVINNLDGYLSACQLGITLTALALGWIGKPAVSDLIKPVFQHFNIPKAVVESIAFIIGFSVITFLHVVVGELAPKTLAIQRAERVTLGISPSLKMFYKIMYPAIWLLNGSAQQLIKLMGLSAVSEHQQLHSEEEIRMILLQSHAGGEITQTELQFARNSLQFADRVAGEIMVPRTDMVCLYVNLSWQENLNIINNKKHARYPVCDSDKDNILGIIYIKDLCFNEKVQTADLENPSPLNNYIRKTMIVTEMTPIDQILKIMQKSKKQLALVVDEYGGTSGLLTIEDILEEIVGQIQDEYDDERLTIEQIGDKKYSVDARESIADINLEFNLNLEAKGVFSLGGWFLEHSQERPELEQTVIENNIKFTIAELDENTIRRITVEFLDEDIKVNVTK
ncbi:MAG: HlyC/CorC family transporter [Firmicutes bacterium]|nr:HlyC/CorC family transporter [Bacillota bacterium]